MENPEKGGLSPEEEADYLKSAKKRALEYLEQEYPNPKEAVISMLSDLFKMPGLTAEGENTYRVLAMTVLGDPDLNAEKARKFIEGFTE